MLWGTFQASMVRRVQQLMVKAMRDNRWSEAIAVEFTVENVKAELGIKSSASRTRAIGGAYALREL
jgi:hypothetical protein